VIQPVSLNITILGQTGQLMDQQGISLNAGSYNINLDTSTLPVGLYLARITTAKGEVFSRKFMKIN
jgi:hypothetical protein